MRLADFILPNREPILAEWEVFARRIWPGAATDPATLRDHAIDILRATAQDMMSFTEAGLGSEMPLSPAARRGAQPDRRVSGDRRVLNIRQRYCRFSPAFVFPRSAGG